MQANSKLHLDVNLEPVRALHRVWRALNDGDCPACHRHFRATQILGDAGTGLQCPACKFHITGNEIDEIERKFAPAMDKAVEIFNDWRTTRTRVVELKQRIMDTSDEILMMSRFNCHAAGITSVVLAAPGDGSMERLFIAGALELGSDDHERGPVRVGLHDHLYDLSITTIFGIVHQVTARELDEKYDTEYSFAMHKWTVGSQRLTPEVQFIKERIAVLHRTSCNQLTPGIKYEIPKDLIHCISVKSPVAIWKVDQQPPIKERSILYTRSSMIDTRGLYRPPTDANHVRSYACEMLDMA